MQQSLQQRTNGRDIQAGHFALDRCLGNLFQGVRSNVNIDKVSFARCNHDLRIVAASSYDDLAFRRAPFRYLLCCTGIHQPDVLVRDLDELIVVDVATPQGLKTEKERLIMQVIDNNRTRLIPQCQRTHLNLCIKACDLCFIKLVFRVHPQHSCFADKAKDKEAFVRIGIISASEQECLEVDIYGAELQLFVLYVLNLLPEAPYSFHTRQLHACLLGEANAIAHNAKRAISTIPRAGDDLKSEN